MDELQILIQAILSLKDITKSKQQIKSELPKLESQLQTDKSSRINIVAGLDIAKSKSLIQTQLNTLASQTNAPTINIGITAGNQSAVQNTINGLKNVQTQAQQTANAVNNIVNTTSLLDTFKRSLANIGMNSGEIDVIANRINGLNVQITSLNQSISTTSGKNGKKVLSVDIAGIDKLGQAIKLTEQYNIDTGELIKSIDALSSATQKSSSQLDNLMAQQIKRRADLNNQVEQIYKAAIDPNASRSITNGTHLGDLKAQYDKIKSSIKGIGSTSKTTFAEQEANVSNLISQLKIMVSEYQKAENVSTTLKPDKLASAISKAESQFQVLNVDINNAGVSSEKLTQNINAIQKILDKPKNGGIINKAEIEQVYTALSNARNELSALVKMKTSDSSIERVRIQAETLISSLNTFANNNAGFDKFSTTINGTVVSVESLKTSLQNVNSQSDLSKVRAQITALETAFKETAVDSNQYVKQINSAITELQRLQNSSTFTRNVSNPNATHIKQEISAIITEYQKLQTQLQGNITPAGLENVRTQLTTLSTRFNQALGNARALDQELKNDNGAEKLAQRTALLTSQIEAYMSANPKAMKKYNAEFQSMLATLASKPDTTAVNQVQKQFQILHTEINKTNLAGKTLFQTFKEKLTKFTGWMSMTYAVSLAVRSVRNMITEVVDLDSALVDLKKTFGGTETDLKNLYISANDTAKELGVTTQEILEQASAWSRLGYSSSEAAETMAKNSAIFSTISPGMDINTATDGLVSMMKAFDIEANDVLDGKMSKVNIVGNKFATDNESIVEAMTRSSAAMAEANNTLEQTVALNTASIEITRNAETTANAWRTVSMRLRGKQSLPPYKEIYMLCA